MDNRPNSIMSKSEIYLESKQLPKICLKHQFYYAAKWQGKKSFWHPLLGFAAEEQLCGQ